MAKTDLTVQLTGEDGNVFNLAGIVTTELKRNGYRDEAKEVSERLFKCESYEAALRMFMEYVNVK
ncbi:hypothetical protein MACA111363_11305 [Macrococcoides canis]|uniref:Uncharacterized protein n=1 Tax=Macrococcoides canis TaxID=1855823 RepID=A0A1W7ACJ4_9STAP|nr:hypothetical protein [Macrococcus canis]ARQ07323.1 hypothetical protein MCCS_16860 [Macrococcus canis]